MTLRLKFIGRGTYLNDIARLVGSNRISDAHLAINYGYQGDRLRDYRRRYPNIDRLPMINREQFGNKYQCVIAARDAGVPIPVSAHAGNLSEVDMDARTWIIKPYYSLGGRDIHRYDGHSPVPATHYLQEDLSARRRYEIRVHVFAWMSPESWIFQKRVHDEGEDQLTWNRHTGGRFITINDPSDALFQRVRESCQRLMSVLGYQFGAVDFIICNSGERGVPLPHYFLEWNLAPGFTLDAIRDYYVAAFNALKTLTMDDVMSMLEQGELQTPAVNEPEELPHQELESFPHEPENSESDETIEEFNARRAQEVELAWQELERLRRRQDTMPPEVEEEREQSDYEAHMQEMRDEMNFCPACGRPVNADIFGFIPRFCTGCGQRVRS